MESGTIGLTGISSRIIDAVQDHFKIELDWEKIFDRIILYVCHELLEYG